VDQVWPRVDLDLSITTYGIVGILAAAQGIHFARPALDFAVKSIAFVGVTGGAAWGCNTLADRWHEGFTEYYAPLFADLPLLPAHVEHICVCDYRYYPWLGDRRQHSVSRPLWLPQRENLVGHLTTFRATYIVSLKHDPFPQGRYEQVAKWMRENPSMFAVEHDDGNHLVARIRLNGAPDSNVAGPPMGAAP